MNYTNKQIDFVMELKYNGKSFVEITDDFNYKFNLQVSYRVISNLYKQHYHKYDLKGSLTPQDIKSEKVKNTTIEIYYNLVKATGKRPSIYNMRKAGVDDATVARLFGNIVQLSEAVLEVFPDVFNNVLDDHLLQKKRLEKIPVKNVDKFFITSIVNDKPLFKKAFDAIKTWEKKEGGKALYMLCSDPASSLSKNNYKAGAIDWLLPPELSEESIILKELALNKNLTLSDIKLTAKQINPLSGLDRLVRGKGSIILASPKQHLKHLPDFSKEGNTLAICTTGAITLPDYNTNRYLSERTGYLASYDHCLGGIIVELEKDGSFHFRPVQFEPSTGAFIDIDKKYHAEGNVTENKPSLVRCGDYHAGETHPIMKKALENIAIRYKPDYLLIEDFNNGHSISPWNRRRLIKRSQQSQKGMTSLEGEFSNMVTEAKFIDSLPFKEVVFIRDNHSMFLERYLDYGEFIQDHENLETALQLALSLHREENITEAGLKLFGFKSDKFRFLMKDESFAPNGIENSIHGFKIKGCKTTSPASYDRAYGAINLGHTHTASIYRNAMVCGTMTYKTSDKIDYIEGASDWTHTMILEHENGSRQLVNIIKGKHRLDD